MAEILVSASEWRYAESESRQNLNSGFFCLDDLVTKYDLERKTCSDSVRNSMVRAFTYQKIVQRKIEAASLQNYERGKVYSLEVAARIGMEQLQSPAGSQAIRDLLSQSRVNLEAMVPDPVNECLKNYFRALRHTVNYGADISAATSEFFSWLDKTVSEIVSQDSYRTLNTFLQKNPIIIKGRKFDACNGFSKTKNEGYDWDGIGGYEEQKQKLIRLSRRISMLAQAASYMQNPIPRGLLMYGPSGTGKTFLARTFAAQSGLPYRFVNAAQEGSPYVNESASKWEKTFSDVAAPVRKHQAPGSLLIVDEIDTVCPDRKHVRPGEDNKVSSVFFQNMDGDRYVPGVMVIAMTNRAYMLDSAILSRFSTTMEVSLPDQSQRRDVFRTILSHRASYASSCQSMDDGFSKRLDYNSLGIMSEDLSCRNIRDIVDEIMGDQLDSHLESGEPIPAITMSKLSNYVQSFKKANEFKIRKNLDDYMLSRKYVQGVHDERNA